MLFFRSLPHNLTARMAQPSSPAARCTGVRRVQEFVHAGARCAGDPSHTEMTAIAGVSARALYYGFQKYLGVTPDEIPQDERARPKRTPAAALR